MRARQRTADGSAEPRESARAGLPADEMAPDLWLSKYTAGFTLSFGSMMSPAFRCRQPLSAPLLILHG
jgi:hypothetical protein